MSLNASHAAIRETAADGARERHEPLVETVSRSRATPAELCSYMCDMSKEMSRLAQACGHGFLAHIFDMAATEASRHAEAQAQFQGDLARELSEPSAYDGPRNNIPEVESQGTVLDDE